MKWFIFFLTLPHLKPDSFAYIWPIMDTLFDIGRVTSAVITLFLYLIKKRIPSTPVWILAAMCGWLCITTYLNDVDIWGVSITTVSILSVALLVDLFSCHAKVTIRAFMLNFEWLIYLNLLSIFIGYPNGIYTRDIGGPGYFLGYRTGFLYYSLMAICVAVLYMHLFQKYLRAFVLIVASYACVIIPWSAASVTALLVIAILFFLPWSQIRQWITFPTIFISTICADLAITVFRITDRLIWAVWFIENILKRQVTFTGRTFIWDQCYRLIAEHPLLGLGYTFHIVDLSGRFNHAHNQYFELLLNGGIIALILFLLFNLAVGKQLIKYRDNPSAYLFLIILVGIYIVYITEIGMLVPLYMLYMLAYHVDKFHISTVPKISWSTKYHVQNRKIPQKP